MAIYLSKLDAIKRDNLVALNIEQARARGATYTEIARRAGVSYTKIRLAWEGRFLISAEETAAINNALEQL